MPRAIPFLRSGLWKHTPACLLAGLPICDRSNSNAAGEWWNLATIEPKELLLAGGDLVEKAPPALGASCFEQRRHLVRLAVRPNRHSLGI